MCACPLCLLQGMGLPCVSVMVYWSSPAEVAGPQVQSIKTMGNLSGELCISQEPSDWLLLWSRLPRWPIRSWLRPCLLQWWDGTGAISLLLRAIDSIGQRRLQHLYSMKMEGGERKEMKSCDRSKENGWLGIGWEHWGNKRTKLNRERRDWKVSLQKERGRAR